MTNNSEPATITRRGAIAAAGAAALALAATSLTGCGSDDKGGDSKEREYLPMGSVVKLSSYAKSDVNHVVISRRPHLSKNYSKDSSGNYVEKDVDITHDYALVPWPIGIINDINKITADVVFADSSDITEILFVGYEDEIEKRAQSALSAAKASGGDNGDAMQDIATDLLMSVEESKN